MLDICASIARGVPWQDLETKQGRVAYVVGEGLAGFRQRVKAYCRANGVELEALDDLFVVSEVPNLLKAEDATDLSSELQSLGQLRLVVIDTLARATPGGNENSAEDVGKALAHCKLIHQKTGALVCLVHHSGKDQAKGARGWSGLLGAVDTEIEIAREGDGDVRQMIIGKQRDGRDHYKLLDFDLRQIGLGHDAKNREITSVVIRRVEGAEDEEDHVRGPKSASQAAVWNALSEAQRRMPIGELLTAAAARLTHDPASGKRDRRRDRVRQAVDVLIQNGSLWSHEDGTYSVPRKWAYTSEFAVLTESESSVSMPLEQLAANGDLVSG
jgi:hypothetical protein